MPIRNKDGSFVKLQGPNTIMKTQDLSEEKLIINNLNPEEIIGEDPSRQHRHIPNAFEILDIDQSIEEFMEEKVEEKVEKVQEVPEIPKTPPKIDSKPKITANKLIAWCLPAFVKEEINALYGEVKRSISYGTKFSFEIIVRERGIVACDFWAPILIDNNSIIYLWDQREWWRVTKSFAEDDGWVLTCYPSERQPSF